MGSKGRAEDFFPDLRTWSEITSVFQRTDATGLRSVDLMPPPLGLPQRSEGLATSNTTSPAPLAIFSLFGHPAHGPGGRKGKKWRIAVVDWPVVVNPSLRWGKPSGGEMTFFH